MDDSLCLAGNETPRYDPASLVDDFGRVFHWQDRIYRGVNAKSMRLARHFLELPNLEEIFEVGLVRTQIAPLESRRHSLILQHEKIHFRTYCMEWSSVMLKEAALMVCDLNIALAKVGFHTKDAHPWNVFFENTRPVFIDFGSVAPLKAWSSSWAAEFARYFLAPLQLFSLGEHDCARQLLVLKASDDLEGFSAVGMLEPIMHRLRLLVLKASDDLEGFSAVGMLEPIMDRLRELLRITPKRGPLWFFRQLRNLIASLDIRHSSTEWSSYDQKNTSDPSEYHPKQRTTYDLLRRLSGSTLIDLGANRGAYSDMACSLGYRVVAFDLDDVSISTLYRQAKAQQQRILPLFLDFCNPTPAHGRAGPCYPEATERLRCEVSLMLALVHHLVFKSHLGFDDIARALDRFTGRYAIVEFIPAEDRYVAEWMTPEFDWYTLDNFMTAMRKYFSRYEVFESSPTPRQIILFDKNGGASDALTYHTNEKIDSAQPTMKSETASSILEMCVAGAGSLAVKRRVLDVYRQLEPDRYLEQQIPTLEAEIAAGSKVWDITHVLNWFSERFEPVFYLEIGVRRGRSMAQVLTQSPNVRAWGFDLWDCGYYAGVPNPGPDFVKVELLKLRCRSLPTFILGDSALTVPAFFEDPKNPQEFDLITVDGDHTSAGALRDLRNVVSHVAPGGMLVFDDITHPAHGYLRDVWEVFKSETPGFVFFENLHGLGVAIAIRETA